MRLIVTLLLLAFTAPAWAEWVAYSDSGNAVWYYDPTTIKKNGNLRRVWQIQDLKQRDKDGGLSRRSLIEYDRKGERVQVLAVSIHSERMADGGVLTSEPGTGNWSYIAPGTVGAGALEIVCK